LFRQRQLHLFEAIKEHIIIVTSTLRNFQERVLYNNSFLQEEIKVPLTSKCRL